jgi:hypothetical protein
MPLVLGMVHLMTGELPQYRYLLRLLPPLLVGDDALPAGDLRRVEGWQFVSERVADDGSDLLVFCSPA